MGKVTKYTDKILQQIGCSLDKYIFIRIQKPYLGDNDYLDLLIKHDIDWVEEQVDGGSYIYNSLDCTLQLAGTLIIN